MDLSAESVGRLVEAYPDTQPLSGVEADHLEMLPSTLESGSYGRRDVEWIVQWYYRRFLGDYPDAERREAEDAFSDNEFDDIRRAIDGALQRETTGAKLECLTDLTGVDVSVATAFLQFLDPKTYLVLSETEWESLRRCGEFSKQYPSRPSSADYDRYLRVCRSVADRCECTLQTLYRALWQIQIGQGRADSD
ncbi:hypothetical protein [Halostagnicola bangensis]